MFNRNKNKNSAPVYSAPTVKDSGPETCLCISCGAKCKKSAPSTYHCVYCGANFTADDLAAAAEKAKREAAAAEARRAPQNTRPTAPQSAAYGASQIGAQSAGNTHGTSARHTSAAPAKTVSVATEARTAAAAPVAVATEMSSEDIYSTNCKGVVEIVTDSGLASGFIISKRGLVLTNAHAVIDENGAPCEKIYVKHGSDCIRAHLIAIGNTDSSDSTNVDLALLKMESVPASAVALKIARSASVRIGQHVYYIGNSKGEGLCMTAGIVSDNNRKVQERYFIMTDAATNPGNSGGPLFNDDGKVIGVHVSARLEAVGMKYAIPADTARLFLNTVEDQLKLPHDTLADNLEKESAAVESVSAGVILTLVLSGISLIVKNIEYIKEIFDTVK